MAIDLGPILGDINSLCAADGANINNAIFTSYIEDADFAQNHRIDTEVRNNKIIPIITATPDYGFLKVSQGNCQTNVCDYDATSSDKKWHPADYDCRLTLCKENLECDFRMFWNMRCKDFDNMDDAFMSFLVDKIRESYNSSMWRIAYFDFTGNTNPDFTGIDGFFQQWTTLAPDPSPNRFDIPENAGATIAAQMTLDPARAYGLLKAMYDYASIYQPQLLATPGVSFYITPELAANYLQYLQDSKEVNCCFNVQNDGITRSGYMLNNLSYLGIPLVIRQEWRNIIHWEQVQTAAVNYDNPHRIVLTYRDNDPVGTCDMDAFRQFDMWYERKDKQILIDVGTSLDVKVVRDPDFVLAM